VWQDIVWIYFCDTFCYRNGFIQAAEVLQGAGEAVHGFGEGRISFERLLIFLHGALVLALSDQVEKPA